LNTEIQKARAMITDLQREVAATQSGYQAQISRMDAEAAARLVWIHDLEAQLATGSTEIERQRKENLEQKATIVERTNWARSLETELHETQLELKRIEEARLHLTAELQALENAKWVRAGRKLQVLPDKE
jgi:chromosome segregation ATPase